MGSTGGWGFLKIDSSATDVGDSETVILRSFDPCETDRDLELDFANENLAEDRCKLSGIRDMGTVENAATLGSIAEEQMIAKIKFNIEQSLFCLYESLQPSRASSAAGGLGHSSSR